MICPSNLFTDYQTLRALQKIVLCRFEVRLRAKNRQRKRAATGFAGEKPCFRAVWGHFSMKIRGFRPKNRPFPENRPVFRRNSLAKSAKGAKRREVPRKLLRVLGVLGERRLSDRFPSVVGFRAFRGYFLAAVFFLRASHAAPNSSSAPVEGSGIDRNETLSTRCQPPGVMGSPT